MYTYFEGVNGVKRPATKGLQNITEYPTENEEKITD